MPPTINPTTVAAVFTLTHVGTLASDVVTLSVDYLGARTEVRGDGSASTFGAVVFERFGGLDERGFYSGHQSWTTGITFGPGTTPGFSSGNVSENPFVLAHGYYVDAP